MGNLRKKDRKGKRLKRKEGSGVIWFSDYGPRGPLAYSEAEMIEIYKKIISDIENGTVILHKEKGRKNN